ncbi:hypothetical protein WH47_11318, partial [Habropoda laboriosa]
VKYSPNLDEIDDLYLKFTEFITSKSNKTEQDVINSKHHLPKELVSALIKHISSLNTNDTSQQPMDIFPPSLTPLHSYFQHLLDTPFYDVPTIARHDFFHTKVGYMTKPEILKELAMKCAIDLEIKDWGLHFLEALKQLVDVQDDLKDHVINESESVNDYLHAKIPCIIKLDDTKRQYYDSIISRTNLKNVDDKDDITFSEILPNGKLAIPIDSDSENEEEKNLIGNIYSEMTLLKNKVCDKYNLHLSFPEKESIRNLDTMRKIMFKRPKTQLERNTKGQFVKGSAIKIEENRSDVFATETSVTSDKRDDIESIANAEFLMADDLNFSDIDLDDINITTNFLNTDEYINLSDISFLSENQDFFAQPLGSKSKNVDNETYKFFRPFKDYWMYHCIFSRVKQKNFAIFEKSLPRSFRWLLNECACIVEMSREDLYEEVCLIEIYHSQILKCNSKNDGPGNANPISKNQLNIILKKW